MTQQAECRSVNIGAIREVPFRKAMEKTAIFKQPTSERITVTVERFGDDRQADLDNHGGPDRIGYAYAVEDLEWWAAKLGREVPPSSMGENLTTAGIDITEALIGEQWQIGTTVFELAGLRTPCFKLGIRMGIEGFMRDFVEARRPGAYLRVIQGGELAAGDPITVVHRPAHGVTMGLFADAYHRDQSLAPRLLEAPQLSEDWREWALEQAG